jgi:SAM-dependent methyltransferase
MTMPLFDTAEFVDADFTSNDWETPTPVARCFVSKVREFVELPGHLFPARVLEIGAGNGQITKHLPARWKVTAIEPKADRCERGKIAAPSATWQNTTIEAFRPGVSFDVILGNPPFGREAFTAIFQAIIPMLKFSGTIALLIPSTFFATGWGADLLSNSGLSIIAKYEIRGRVAFLRNGSPVPNRQCQDAFIFLGTGRPAVEIINPWGE